MQIVAARQYNQFQRDDILSIGISSPGTLWSSKKFGFDKQDLAKTSFTLLQTRDPVPKIDKHIGIREDSRNDF